MSEPTVTKVWYESKTIWINLASALVVLLEATEITAVIPPERMPFVTAIVFALNMVLRITTSQPLRMRAPDGE